MEEPRVPEEREWFSYDGSIPPDQKFLSDNVNAPALALLGPLLASIGIGALLKLAFLAFSIFMFFKQRKVAAKERGTLEAERAYGFQLENTFQPDTPLSIVYGEHRVYPHYFYQKLSNKGNNNRLDLGLGIGEGPIESVSEIKVNDIAVAELVGSNSTTTHLGNNSTADVDGILNSVAYTQDFSEEIESHQSITRSGQLTDCNELEVGILLPEGLFRIDEEKGPKGLSVFLRFEYKRIDIASQPWVHAFDETINAKHRGELRRTFTVARNLTPGQYQVRITNLTDERDEFENTDTVYLDFINEYHKVTFDVPYFAYLGMTLEATSGMQGRTPEVSCLVKGRKVRVYTSATNYTVSWSDNPVWCLADLLTDTRYGLGRLIRYEDLDLSSFVTVATYCDGTDTYGNRRGQLDLVVNTLRPALDWIETILDTFGGILKMVGNKISLTVFRDEAAVQSFNESNILEGTFKYEYADPNESSRVNTIRGAFLNRDKSWARDVVTVQATSEVTNPADVIEKNVDIHGVTRAAAVEAQLRKTLNSIRTNIRSATWSSDLSTINCEVGDVVLVTHSLPGWVNKKFRILQIEEKELGERVIRAIEHTAAVFDSTASDLTPVIETTLVNPFTTAGAIEDLDVYPHFVRLDDGTIRQDILVSWSVADNNFYSIDHFEVYYDEDAGTLLPNGTAYNATDTTNYRFFNKTTSTILSSTGVSDGTVVSGTRVPSTTFAGGIYPPDTSFTIQNTNPNSFYDIGVIAITNNFIRQDIDNAVRELVFAEEYGEAPDNTSSFTATYQDGDIVLAWTAVSAATNTDFGGYEVRLNGSFGTIDSNLVFRGNQTSFTLRNVTYRSRTFYIKTYNTTGVYSTTSRSVTASNPLPGTSAMSAAVVNGKTARLSWTASGASDVIGYRIDVSTAAGFTPSNATLYKNVTGRLTVSELFTETDSTFPVRYVRVAQRDALSDRLGDWTWSPPISFQCEEEVSFFDSVSINLINDSDFNGISPGYWSGPFTYGTSTIRIANTGYCTQIIPNGKKRTNTDWIRLRVDARRVSGSGGYLYFLIASTVGNYGLLNAWDLSGVTSTTTWTELEYPIEKSRFTNGGDDWRVTFLYSGGTGTIEIDHAMLHDGRDPLLWIPHAMEQITGYTNWVGTTQITENAITTGKLATNAITADKIASGAIATRHLSADVISATEIQTNSITADLYQELRNTLYFKFAGEVDSSHPLDVLFHLPEELLALTDGGIQQIKLSYAVQPFRATSKAGTALGGGSTTPATLTQGAGAHTHTLRVSNTTNNITYIYSDDGGNNWKLTAPAGANYPPSYNGSTLTFRVESADGHTHDWNVTAVSTSTLPAGARVLWVSGSTLSATNGGGTITLRSANGTAGSHIHNFQIPGNGTAVPTTGRVSKGTGTTGNSVEHLHCFNVNGTTATSSSVQGPNSYQVTIPAHTHEVQFGIYQETNAVTIGVRRSDNGFAFENTDYVSSASTSVINQDLNGSNFYTAGAGPGFKALRFVSSGANEGRCRIDGVIMVKVDISA